MTYDVLHSETVFRGRAFAVRRDAVRLPDGSTTTLDIVQHHGAVTLLPVDANGFIWFVRQYRHAAGMTLLELPAGTLEPNEPPYVCAARELREEIGMAAAELRKIGEFFLAPGYSTEYMHVYLATDLHPDPMPHDADEFLEVERISVKQAFEMAQAGHIRDAKSLASLMLARPYLNNDQ